MTGSEPSPAIQEICRILNQLRATAGLTDRGLAARCGYSVSQVNAIRNGKIARPPSDQLIERWVRACAANAGAAEFALAEIRELATVHER